VHVSAMSRTFVSDPRSVVKPGDVVRVKVLSVDIPRHRISLTLRLDDEDPPQAARQTPPPQAARQTPPPQAARQTPRPAGGRARPQDRSSGKSGRTDRGPSGALADALRRAGLDPKRPDTGSIG